MKNSDPKMRKGCYSLLAGLFLTGQSIAQEDRYVVQRIQHPVTLDGYATEAAWQNIEPLPLVTNSPTVGDPPSEKTELLIGYDENYVYFAGRCYDSEADKMLCASKKRDYLGPNTEWVGFILDTFNDKENGVSFWTTPTGLRLDMSVFNDAEGEEPLNPSWNTFWDVAVQRNEEGFFAEFRVPFSSLRFQETDGQVVMGMIAYRWIARKYETDIFPAISQQWGGASMWKVSQAREIVFRDIQNQNPLYVTPYLSGGIGYENSLNETETAYEANTDQVFEPGLDIKYGLTSNLTLDVTVNTDFAQVEADDEQVNLTRYSLFFPEKRQFFQERSSNFEMNLGGPNELFYSRRIGLFDGKPVRIYGGARVVGRAGPWDVGFLNMQTAKTDSSPSENFGVLRLRRQVFNSNSYMGGILTNRMGRDGSYNTAYGADAIIRMFGQDYLSARWAHTFDHEHPESVSAVDKARINVEWMRRNREGLGYELGYSRSGPEYNPGMGFVGRENYTRLGGRLLYGWKPGQDSRLMTNRLFLTGEEYFRNSDNSIETTVIGPGWLFQTKSGIAGSLELMLNHDEPDTFDLSDDVLVPTGTYDYVNLLGQFNTPPGRKVFFLASIYAGQFFDGNRMSMTLMPEWSVSSDFALGGYYEFNHVDFPERKQKMIAQIWRLRLTYMLNTSFSASAFIQYNSEADAVIANVRFRYNPREGNDLYLVYDHGLNTDRYREIPVLPRDSNRTLLVKYTYTFVY